MAFVVFFVAGDNDNYVNFFSSHKMNRSIKLIIFNKNYSLPLFSSFNKTKKNLDFFLFCLKIHKYRYHQKKKHSKSKNVRSNERIDGQKKKCFKEKEKQKEKENSTLIKT